jgi:transcriptional regulator of acetoin/glycerol metabolism
LFQFDETYRKNLREAWKRFEADDESLDLSVRPVILESWKRSKRYGVNPAAAKPAILNREAIEARIEANKRLLQISRPYLKQLYTIVAGSGFYLMICDRNGVILDLLGDEDIIREGRMKSNLVVGADRSEQYAGTNAIGACIATGAPIQIWGEEHYMKQHRIYACSGGPIRDENGEIVGCLNLTGLAENVHLHTLGMVLSAVDGISKEMRIHKAYADIRRMNEQSDIILDAVMSGFLLLDEHDRVVRANPTALQMLQTDEHILDADFFDCFDIGGRGAHTIRLSSMQTLPNSEEFDFFRKGSGMPPVKLSLSIFRAGEGSAQTLILKLDEPRHIHRLAGKVSGFSARFTFEDIIGNSDALKSTIALSRQAAGGDSIILILGESGTGKELIAHAIHNASRYSGGPFVAINCGALPKGLIESELFGYEAGAFTGAAKNGSPGKFELADGGTIFLDEIGDMPLDVQASLLRVIETREVVRIGGRYSKLLNVRVVTATNRNLMEQISEGSFREDLYYRLNVIPIEVPPLRARRGDVRLLAEHFARVKRTRMSPKRNEASKDDVECASLLPAEVLRVLESYDWPGNIRELENAMERAVGLSGGETIQPSFLPEEITGLKKTRGFSEKTTDSHYGEVSDVFILAPPQTISGHPENTMLNIENLECAALRRALAQTGGNIQKSAELLGFSRRTLYRKMEKYEIIRFKEAPIPTKDTQP